MTDRRQQRTDNRRQTTEDRGQITDLKTASLTG